MPELPDAAGYRRLIARALHHLDRVELVDPKVLRNADPGQLDDAMNGQDVCIVERRGKWLVIHVERAALVIHLGMTGSLALTVPDGARHRDDRAVLHGDAEIRFRDRRRLGGIWLSADAADPAGVAGITGPLGPDAARITVEQLGAALARRRTALKTALTDQATIAGLGNTLSDEVLWAARLAPSMRTDALSSAQSARLHAAMRDVVRRAARAGAIPRTPQWLTSQRSAPVPICPRCHGPLARSPLAGRTSLWCPRCQRAGR